MPPAAGGPARSPRTAGTRRGEPLSFSTGSRPQSLVSSQVGDRLVARLEAGAEARDIPRSMLDDDQREAPGLAVPHQPVGADEAVLREQLDAEGSSSTGRPSSTSRLRFSDSTGPGVSRISRRSAGHSEARSGWLRAWGSLSSDG